MLIKHVNEIFHSVLSISICKEFETIQERALKVPESSEEMMEMITYVEKARIEGIKGLKERIEDSRRKMNFLLDIYFFQPEHIQLNKTVLLWPSNIQPIFDDNDEVREGLAQEGKKSAIFS